MSKPINAAQRRFKRNLMWQLSRCIGDVALLNAVPTSICTDAEIEEVLKELADEFERRAAGRHNDPAATR